MKNLLDYKKTPKSGLLRLPRAAMIMTALLVFILLSPPASAQTCNCPGSTQGPELLPNPNFSVNPCYTSYTTDFIRQTCGTTPAPSSGRCLETAGAGYWPTWVGTALTAPRCLVYDGPRFADLVIRRDTILVDPDGIYRFSTFFQSTCPTCTFPTTTIFMRVNNQPLAGSMTTATATNPNTWTFACGRWHADGATRAIVEIVVVANTVASGNDGAIDSVSFRKLIAPADPSFTFTTPKCDADIQFTSASIGSGFTHSWDFGDGDTSTQANPIHRYNGGGIFVVRHTVSDSCSSNTDIDTIKLLNCCKCDGCGPNLVKNGDFSDTCRSQYTTDLLLRPCPNGATDPNHTTEVTDASIPYPKTWCGLDHTGGGTKFLVLDAPTSGPPKKGWKQRVKVEPGHVYCFSAWVRNICYEGPSLPSIFLQITDNTGAHIVAEANDIPYNECCGAWSRICGTWEAPAGADSVELSIGIKSGAWTCTDAGVDDISFSDVSIGADASFTVDNMPCAGDSIQFTRNSHGGKSSWTFGDGGTSTADNPVHVYSTAGTYIVTHIIENSCGKDTTIDTIYVACCCIPCGPNLVPNGDFSSSFCATGYRSDLSLHPNCLNSVGMIPGQFTEDTDASTVQANWHGTDHTGNGSRILILDYEFPPQPPLLDTGWTADAHVIPGKKYCLSLYVKNLYVYSTPATSPGFSIRINSIEVHVDSTLDFDSAWTKICASWTAPPGVYNANLALLMLPATAGVGCDLGVDDIVFTEACPMPGPMLAPPNQGTQEETGKPGSEAIKGAADGTETGKVMVHPVPVKKGEPVFISYEATSDAHITVTVFDEIGKQVMATHADITKGQNTITLKTANLSFGVYYIRLYPPNSENSIQKMIVIE